MKRMIKALALILAALLLACSLCSCMKLVKNVVGKVKDKAQSFKEQTADASGSPAGEESRLTDGTPAKPTEPSDTTQEAHVHSFGAWKTVVEPTCTERGYKERVCACGERETATMNARGHSFGAWKTVKQPTCTEAGSKERACSCGQKETATMNALGHSYNQNGVCTRCGKANYRAGDTVYFGSYEQDNNTYNGKEAIAWTVLEVKDGTALLLSVSALDSLPYNTNRTETAWKDCSLRRWLNNDFYNTAFNSTERARIVSTRVEGDNPVYGKSGGFSQDKVFLPGVQDMANVRYGYSAEYLDTDGDRTCKPTAYAIARGCYADPQKNGCCWYWLRSPGDNFETAAYVTMLGIVRYVGVGVENTLAGVRPMIRISLNA